MRVSITDERSSVKRETLCTPRYKKEFHQKEHKDHEKKDVLEIRPNPSFREICVPFQLTLFPGGSRTPAR
jgi:hypothetical protein